MVSYKRILWWAYSEVYKRYLNHMTEYYTTNNKTEYELAKKNYNYMKEIETEIRKEK